jgi:serine/threonine protein kinase
MLLPKRKASQANLYVKKNNGSSGLLKGKNKRKKDRSKKDCSGERDGSVQSLPRVDIVREKRRHCQSLDIPPQGQQQAVPPAAANEFSPNLSLLSDKKTFTPQTTLTLNHKPPEDFSATAITQRLADLFSKIEREEGEPEEVTKLKREIADSFKISHEGPKTTLYYYKILKLLGKGSFGKVYMASQLLTNRVVAIKCLDTKMVREESRKNKIMHELLMFKKLAGHPNVIQIYEVFQNQKYFFFVMEYASGGDLLQLMKKKSRLSEKTARGIFVQLVRGLQFIHSKKILHRDIKLDNILLTDSEGDIKAKICDFGVSRLMNDGDVVNEQCGTPAYIAPEIIRKKGYSGFKADVWSLGVLLYAMVYGAMPFKANNIDGLHEKILTRDCDLSDTSVSPEAKELIEGMLTLIPEDRMSLDQVANHHWTQLPPVTQSTKQSLEPFVLHKLQRLGFSEEHIRSSIKNCSLNHAFACYMTLSKDFD